jgi:hypothetical protein
MSELDYGGMMHRAMRGLVREVLDQVADEGLPGDHHFFISFDTSATGVKIADWLRERYPEEMTVVIQHWFDHLEIEDDQFGITLNFGDAPEHLVIPYAAILTFVDPSVEFGLRFETSDAYENDEDLESEEQDTPSEPDQPTESEVVILDKFRK